MPIARFQMPDGRVARFEVPDGTSPEQAQSMMEAHFSPAPYDMKTTGITGADISVDTLPNKALRFLREGVRAPSMALKNLAQGEISLAGLATDTPAKLYDSLAGLMGLPQSPQWLKPAESFNHALESPELAPQSPQEQLTGNITQALGSSIAGMGAGSLLSATKVPALAGIGNSLQAAPGTQVAAAITAPVAAQVAQSAGGGPTAQLLASLAGGAIPGATGAILPRGSAMTGAQAKTAMAGKELGMHLTPGQATGSKSLQQWEAKAESQPWTAGPFNNIKQGNQEVLNKAWAAKLGENGGVVDSTLLSKANDRLGDVFDSVRSPNKIVMANPQTTTSIIDVIDQQVRGLIPGSIRDNPLVSDLESTLASGAINGEQLGALSSKLGKSAAKQMTGPSGDRDLGMALYKVKDHVDDMVETTLSGTEAKRYSEARQQYRTLMQLTARQSNLNPNTGNVSGANLANYLQRSDRNGFLYGRNQSDAYNATRFAQAFKPTVGDSGTATRSPNFAKITEWPSGIPANLLTRAYLSRPISGMLESIMNRSPQPFNPALAASIPELSNSKKLAKALGAN